MNPKPQTVLQTVKPHIFQHGQRNYPKRFITVAIWNSSAFALLGFLGFRVLIIGVWGLRFRAEDLIRKEGLGFRVSICCFRLRVGLCALTSFFEARGSRVRL